MKYPPAVGLLSIQLSSRNERLLGEAADTVLKEIRKRFFLEGPEVIGPAEQAPYKVNDIYRKILYIKHENYDILLQIGKSVLESELLRQKYRNVSAQYDLM